MKLSLRSYLIGAVAVGLFSSQALALSLSDSLTARPGFSVSGVDGTSYDRPVFNAFKPFGSQLNSSVFSAGSFTGGGQGAKLEFTMLSEAGFYDGNHIPGKANNFGVVDSKGDFHSIIDSKTANPGFSTEVFQGADEQFTLALLSPEGLFTTDDASNSDGAAHILARQVEKDGQIKIKRPDLLGLSSTIIFNLLAGDIVLFMEDLVTSRNALHNGIPGDFDYNDMVVVVRSSEVPEPATMLLFGFGALGASALRRRKLQA